MAQPPPPPIEARWSSQDAGFRYRTSRWKSERAAGRDFRLLQRLLKRYQGPGPIQDVLDLPCGTGRLHTGLSQVGRVTGVDISLSMLQARAQGRAIQGSALQLPLRDKTFDLVVSCRLLHHLDDSARRQAILAEYLRVGRGLVLASFWDRACWHAWRRRMGLRRARHPDGRIAISRDALIAECAAAGGQVLGFSHSLRGISPQAWVAIRPRS